MSERECAACGRPQWPDDKFCSGCGEPSVRTAPTELVDLGEVGVPGSRDRELHDTNATTSNRLRTVLVGLVAVMAVVIIATTVLSGGTNDGDALDGEVASPTIGPSPIPTAAPTAVADEEAQPAVEPAPLQFGDAADDREAALRQLGQLGLGDGWLVFTDEVNDYRLLNLQTGELRDPALLRLKQGRTFERVLSSGLLVEAVSSGLGSSWVWSPWDESGVSGFDKGNTFTLAVLQDPDHGPILILQQVDDSAVLALKVSTQESKEIRWSADSVSEASWRAIDDQIWLPASRSVWKWQWDTGWVEGDEGDTMPAEEVLDVVVQCETPTDCSRGVFRDDSWSALPPGAEADRVITSPDQRRLLSWSRDAGGVGSETYTLTLVDEPPSAALRSVTVGEMDTWPEWLTNDAIFLRTTPPQVLLVESGELVEIPNLDLSLAFWWLPKLQLG